MLPAHELREALAAENRADLLVAASDTADASVVALCRSTLEPLFVPAEWFRVIGSDQIRELAF